MGYMTLPGPSVSGFFSTGSTQPISVVQEVTVQDVLVQEVTVQELTVWEVSV